MSLHPPFYQHDIHAQQKSLPGQCHRLCRTPCKEEKECRGSGCLQGKEEELHRDPRRDTFVAFLARFSPALQSRLVSTLEESVLAFQQTSREIRAEVQDLQQENARLRLDIETQEKVWRAFCLSVKPGNGGNNGPILLLFNGTGAPVGQSTFQYQEEQLNYRSTDSCPTVFGGPRDPRWPLQPIPATGGVTHQMSQVPPVSLEPPSLTSRMSFPSRSFGAPEEQKNALELALEAAPYCFFGRPLLAIQSLPPSSPKWRSTCATISPSFQHIFCDTMGQSTDRQDFNYQRHSLPQGEVTLRGGTTDVSSLSGLPSDAVIYRLNSGEPEPGTSTFHFGGSGKNGSSSHHDPAGSDSKVQSAASRKRRRPDTDTPSRSPSPSYPSLSHSVTVIKAQAFGALRRPRRASKTDPESSAKVAMEAVEAQGLGIGIKRPRMDNENLSMGI